MSRALEVIEDLASTGKNWLVLENGHLGDDLLQIQRLHTKKKFSDHYRLWIIAQEYNKVHNLHKTA